MVARASWRWPLVATMLLAGCSSSGTRAHHDDGDGILSVRTGEDGGSWALDPPTGPGPWSATFGLYILCTEGGRSARLEGLSWDAGVEPRKVVAYVRSIPDAREREAGKQYDPIGSMIGAPEEDPSLGGTFVDYRGVDIDRPCVDGPPDPTAAREELVLVISAGDGGAAVDSFAVEYAVKGRSYALDVAWAMALCGEAVPDDVCPG